MINMHEQGCIHALANNNIFKSTSILPKMYIALNIKTPSVSQFIIIKTRTDSTNKTTTKIN